MKYKLRCRFGLFVLLLVSSCSIVRAQNISVSPKLIAFPNQGINSTSAAYSVTVLNNQAATLTISSIQVSAPYSQTNNCGTTPGAQRAVHHFGHVCADREGIFPLQPGHHRFRRELAPERFTHAATG